MSFHERVNWPKLQVKRNIEGWGTRMWEAMATGLEGAPIFDLISCLAPLLSTAQLHTQMEEGMHRNISLKEVFRDRGYWMFNIGSPIQSFWERKKSYEPHSCTKGAKSQRTSIFALFRLNGACWQISQDVKVKEAVSTLSTCPKAPIGTDSLKRRGLTIPKSI